MSDIDDEIAKVSGAFVEAILSNKADRIAACVTEDWVLVTPEVGPVSREDFLKAVADGILVHHTMSLDIVRVRRYGDVAIVTARGRNTGLFRGEPMSADEWTTDVYRHTQRGWLCALTQLTPVRVA